MINFSPGEKYDTPASQSETIRMLSRAAKDAGIWLIGGEHTRPLNRINGLDADA